jgi:chromosome segregation ATPase
MNLIYTNPNSSISLLKGEKQDKRAFLERMFNLTYFSQLLKKLNDKLNKNQKNITEIEKELYKTDSIISMLQNDLKESQIPDLTIYTTKIKTLTDALDSMTTVDPEKLNDLNDTLGHLTNELVHYNNINSKISSKIRHLNRRKTSITNELNAINILLDVQNVEDKSSDIEELTNKLDLFKNSLVLLESEIQKHNILVVSLKTEINGLVKHKKDLFKEKTGVKPGDICPTCQRVMDEEFFNQYQEEQQRKIDQLNEQLDSKNDELKGLDTVLDKMNDMYSKNNEKYQSDLQLLEQLKKEQDKYLRYQEIKQEKTNQKSKTERLSDRINKAFTRLEECGLKYQEKYKKTLETEAQIKGEIQKLEKALDSVQRLENEIEHNKELLIQQEKRKEEIEELRTTKTNKIKDLQKEKSVLEKKNRSLFTLKDYLLYFKDILSDEKIKQHAIKETLPFLNKKSNYYLSQAGYEYYLDIDS